MDNEVLYNRLICFQFLWKRNNNQVCITSNISKNNTQQHFAEDFLYFKDSVSLLLSQKVLQCTRESFESHLCSLTLWSYLKKRSRNYRWNKLWVMVEKGNLFDNEWLIWWYEIWIKETELWGNGIKSASLHFYLDENKTWRCKISRKIGCYPMFV